MAETVNVRALSPEPMQIKKVKDYRLKTAGFWTRFWAYLIDLIVISSLTSILVKPLFLLIGWEDLEILHLSLYGSVTSFIFYIYFVLMTKLWGQTIGKMALGIRVVSENQKPLTWGTVLFRECIGRIISVTVKILYIIVAFTPCNKAIHDYIADTIVVHENTFEEREKEIAVEIKQEQKETEF
ncbi:MULTISPECIES: RDD family protein [unclassified Rummeliibacillus]|uniref:RDD family protein n=1 Tax=unclassified Rummeliibacillus TaxID=2622809 RepID=UPI001F32303C|nr:MULTISPECIES: RDD family protein [unclassified Rummeliibacillus]